MLRAVAYINPLPGYTYATLPSASSVGSGYRVRATDIGIAPGMVLVSDGTRWNPDGVQVLARSTVAVNAPADTNENTLATVTVPAGLMGTTGSLRLTSLWSFTNSANNKTLRARFGGAGGTAYMGATLPNLSILSDIRTISNLTASTQNGPDFQTFPSNSFGTGSVRTSSIDTSVATTLVFTGQKATAGETLTLVSYMVEIFP